MSTNCPPQLHLTLPSNATSFKRSFEQFGFDIDSPSAEPGSSTQSASSGSDGNDRNKRARSTSSSSHRSRTIENSSRSPSSLASSASSSAISVLNEDAERSELTATRPPTLPLSTLHRHSFSTQSSFLEAPRLPTPEMQDIVMSDYSSVATTRSSTPGSPIQPATTEHDEQYRISLERFNAFDSQISALRQSRSPPAVRSPTPPPVLPPLALSSDAEDRDGLHTLHTSTNATPIPPPLASHLSDGVGLPLAPRSQMPGRDTTVWERFESRLDGRSWLHDPRGSGDTSVPESRAPLTDTPRHDHVPSFASSHLFTSAPRTEVSPPTVDPPIVSRSRPSRPRAEPSEHMIFRDRLDSALDVLRSPSPLFSDLERRPFTGRHEGAGSMALLHTRTQGDDGHTRGNTWTGTFVEPVQGNQPREDASVPFRAPASSSSRHEGFSFSWSERNRRLEPQLESSLRNLPLGNHDTPISTSTHAPSRVRTGTRIFNFDRETDTAMTELDHEAYPPHQHVWHSPPGARPPRGGAGPHTSRFLDLESSDLREERSPRPEYDYSEDVPPSRRPDRLEGSLQPQSLMRDGVEDSENTRASHVDGNSRRPQRTQFSSPDYEGVQGWRPFNVVFSRVSRPPSVRDPRSVFGHRAADTSVSTRFRRSSDISSSTEDIITETEPLRLRNPISQPGNAAASLHRARSRASVSNSLVAENAAELRQRLARAQLAFEFNDDRSLPLGDPSDDENVWYNEPHPRVIHRGPPAGYTDITPLSHRDTRGYLASGSLPRGYPSNLGVNTSAPSPRATLFTGRMGDTFDPPSSSRHYHHSRPSLWNDDRASAEGSQDAPIPPSATPLPESLSRGLFDTYVPSFADGLTSSFEPADRHGQESDVSTSTQAAALFASQPGPNHREFVHDARQHVGNGTSGHISHGRSLPFSLPMPDLTGFNPTPFYTTERNHSPSPLQSDMSLNARARFRSRFSGTGRLRSPSPQERETRSLNASTRPSASTLPGPNQSSTYRNIDLSAYHDGPFRASLQRFVELDRMRSRLNRLESLANGVSNTSNPPSIPPLRFEDDFSPFNGGDLQPGGGATSMSGWGSPSSRRDPEVRQDRVIDPTGLAHTGIDQHDDFRERRSIAIPSRNRLTFRSSGDSTRAYEDDAQSRRNVYSFLNRQPRIEASRIEAEEIPSRRPGEVEAIDMLRGDGRNAIRQQQLIERFHSQSQERRRTTPSFWGDVEGESEGSQFLPSRPQFSTRGRGVMGHDRHHPGFEHSGSARTNSTAPNTASRHRPTSRSPVRDEITTHSRFRARFQGRRRLDNETAFGNLPRMDLVGHAGFRRRGRPFGDYMRDEDFDSSYENLLSIATALGEAKSRAVPEHVITSLPTGFYKDWATPGSDQRCPICLDDYKPLDRVLKLSDCSHWLHKGCLEQWLRGASTCPVCRKCVNGTRGHSDEDGPSGSRSDEDRGGDDEDDPIWNSIPLPWGY